MVIPLLCVLLLLGVWCSALGWLSFTPWLLIVVGVGSTLGALLTRRGVAALLLIGLALACWGCLLAGTLKPSAAATPQAGMARVTVEPLRTACGLQGCWAEARMVRCSALDADTCASSGTLLSLTSAQELPVGARVTALAKVSARTEFRNPSFASEWPDLRPPLRARVAEGAGPRIEDVGWLPRLLHRARGAIRQRFDQTLVTPHAGIARALLLGEASAVSNELNDAIRNAGVSHVLAVSGMHVTVLVGALVALLRWLWLRSPLALRWEARRAAACMGACLAPLVASLCGGSPSAVRAALTSTLMFALTALGRRPSALSVSAFAVGMHIALEPRDVVHPGFVLSVVATAALLTAATQSGSGVWKSLMESVRAWLSTAPFLVLCFGSTSLVAILANVVLLPLGGLLIPVAVAQLVAAFLGVDAWLGTRTLFEAASGAFVGASRLCSQLDPGIRVPALNTLQLLALSVMAGLWLLPCSLRTRLGGSLLALLAVGLGELRAQHPLQPHELSALFLDVGQGDATLLHTGDGHALLIDAGGCVGGGPDPGAESVLPVLSALRLRKLDVVVLSHPHPDHYNGLRAVFEAVEVAEVWDTGQAEAEGLGAAQRLIELARARGAKVRRPSELCTGPHWLGSARVDVLAPCPQFDEGYGPNDNSLVLRLVHGQRSFLFTGDVEQAGEAQLVAQHGARLKSDVMKVAHHGSRTSSTRLLLGAVQPWLSVVSAGRANRFGHPHADVLERLAANSRHTLRTDLVGGVQVRSDGVRLAVRAHAPHVALGFAPAAPGP